MSITLENYTNFQKSNFQNHVTPEQYETAKVHTHTIQGWVVGVDPEKDIRDERKEYTNFKDIFKSGSKYAAVFPSNQNFKRVVYIPWDEHSVIYCPPDKNGKPQSLVEPKANSQAKGYPNIFFTSAKVIYSDDSTKVWKEAPVNEIITLISGGADDGTTVSTGHTNAVIIKS